jgi:hypothetical protein
MILTTYSKNKLLQTFAQWAVPKDFSDPMYNYLVYGWSPGSCFTAVLANDFTVAILRSHPGNTVASFKALAGWISDTVPNIARGSYGAVDHWCSLTDHERRSVLENHKLIFTSKEEVVMCLKDERTVEPILW